jgi:predicted metal-dependent hydrolase
VQEKPAPVVRRISFDYSNVDVTAWHPRLPEFACGANAISLLMPHAEPYVIRAVRSAARQSDDEELKHTVNAWAGQEAAHFRAHRVFNEQLLADSRVARLLDKVGKRIFGWLAKRSPAFGAAFAAAFEIVAFASARWTEERLTDLMRGADDEAASLYLWHLAEEIEHKGVAHDVMEATEGSRRFYPLGTLTAFVFLIGFTLFGGLALFVSSRHVFNPIRWLRLIGWGFSLAWVLLPMLAASLTRDFHPESLVDPPWMAQWLLEFDPATNTLPVWTEAGLGRGFTATPPLAA